MMDHQRLIFFFCVIISSDVDSLKTLTASVGGNITLPDAMEEEGFLLYQGNVLATVADKKLMKIFTENFKERLNWDQKTGYFTLIRLQKNFSGIYKVDSKKRREFSVEYNLVVYDSVSTPKVSVLNRSSESCSLSCSINSTQDDVTLLWLKDEKMLKKSHSAASLSLTVFYQQDQNSYLHCVAGNPAENKTVSVYVWRFCKVKRQNNLDSSSSSNISRHHWIIIIIITTLATCIAIVLLIAYIIRRFCHQKTLTVEQTEGLGLQT